MRTVLAVVSMVGLAAACSVVPRPAAPPHVHDFGPLSASSAASAPAAALPAGVELRVDAPAWLDGEAILYRTLYDHPSEVRRYAANRWVAAPSALLEQALETQRAARPPAPTTVKRAARLHVELLTFEQEFRSPTEAEAVIRVRVELTLPNAAGPRVRTLVVRQPTRPDVDGAVAGLAAVAREAARRIVTVTWAALHQPAG